MQTHLKRWTDSFWSGWGDIGCRWTAGTAAAFALVVLTAGLRTPLLRGIVRGVRKPWSAPVRNDTLFSVPVSSTACVISPECHPAKVALPVVFEEKSVERVIVMRLMV